MPADGIRADNILTRTIRPFSSEKYLAMKFAKSVYRQFASADAMQGSTIRITVLTKTRRLMRGD